MCLQKKGLNMNNWEQKDFAQNNIFENPLYSQYCKITEGSIPRFLLHSCPTFRGPLVFNQLLFGILQLTLDQRGVCKKRGEHEFLRAKGLCIIQHFYSFFKSASPKINIYHGVTFQSWVDIRFELIFWIFLSLSSNEDEANSRNQSACLSSWM